MNGSKTTTSRGPRTRRAARRRALPGGRAAAARLAAAAPLLAAAAVACRPEVPAGVPPASVPVASVTVSPDPAAVPVAGRLQLEVTVRDEEGDTVTDPVVSWTSSAPGVAEVDENGGVEGVAPGSTTVTATSGGVSGAATIEVRGFLIGPDGGVAISGDGMARADFPVGALPDDLVVTIERAGAAAIPAGPGAAGFVPGSGYEFGPDGQGFRPARLTIRYDEAALSTDVPESSLRLARAEGGDWTPVAGSTVDPAADEVRGDVTGFSVYGAVGVPRDDPPQATIAAPADGSGFPAGQPVGFAGSGTDREDGPLGGSALAWSSHVDGALGTGGSLTASGLSIGPHIVTLTATDLQGQTGTDQIAITIQNNPPSASITSPNDGAIFLRTADITFTGTGTDPDDGTLTGGALVWTSSVDGQFGTGESVTASSGTLSPGNHTITLTVTDANGGTATDRIGITIL